ncbi:MAG: DUF4160 domain-containing protein [Acidobacteriaceae bacterium]|nr:DUF4160 domain-containing protein [Acidobacteriaceae bacterium]
MPTISRFYGIIIQMYFGDHVPPHFHAVYAEFEALIDIQTLAVVQGELPRRAMALVLEWAQQHREELRRNWELCVQNRTPVNIIPLS